MTAPVERLQGLLGLVQRNRRASRGSTPAQAPSAPAALDPEILAQDEFPLEPERGSIPITLDAGDAPPPPVEVPRAAAVPFEARASRSYDEPEREAAGAEGFDDFPAAEGSVITAPPVAQPTRPIAHVVSRHPPAEAATFGKLLSRSLSLRAR